MKLAEVVHHDHTLVPIINRFGIHLGFGDDNITEICEKHQLNLDFFLSILNGFHDTNYFPKEKLQHFPAAMLIEYLQKAHQDFLREKLPEISHLINNMAEELPLDKTTSELISNFFTVYTRELTKHILREEEKVYPYILRLEKAISENNKQIGEQITENLISEYESEHDNVEEKLFDLKNILIKYLPEPQNDKPAYRVLRELFTLEKELNEHARIEDLILVPKMKALEAILKSKK